MLHRTRTSRFFAGLPALATVALAATFTGCSHNPYVTGPGSVAWQGQPVTTTPEQAQLAELNRRVQLLDDNNRQLTTQLAQSEQRAQVYQDELDLLRTQLADTTQQFEAAKIAADRAESRARSFQASTQLRGSASIKANTNISAQASRLKLNGIPIEQDGDKVRIILPSDQLFQPGSVQLLPQASSILDPIAAQLRSVFPRQRLSVEAFTDDSPLYGGQASTSQQLTAAQATAIYGLLTRRSGIPEPQLYTVSHGSNRPEQPNDSAARRAGNRRIEIVVHPATF